MAILRSAIVRMRTIRFYREVVQPMDLLFYVLFAYVLIMQASAFYEGYYHEKGKEKFSFLRRGSIAINLDSIFFGALDEKLIKAADRLAFLVCVCSSFFIAVSAVLFFSFKAGIFNLLSLAFLAIGLLGSWLLRFAFIFIYKNKPPKKIPRIFFDK